MTTDDDTAKPATIRDVARAAGVSTAAVSRVLNDGPVAPSTKAHVLEVMAKLSYRPLMAARQLKHGSTKTLGLILADVANPFFARLADRVVSEARARDIQVLLMTTQEDPRLETGCLDAVIERQLGAVIATPTGANPDRWSQLRAMGTEVIFMDRAITDLEGPDVVTIDNFGSARTATSHLTDLGHRRIGFVSGPASTSTGRARLAGYREVLRENDIPFDQRLVHPVNFRGTGGTDAVSTLLNSPDRPTAMVVANTAQVQNAMRRLSVSGLRVPEELSVIVFDDDPWAELMTPPLTAIRQPIDMLAMHAVDLAVERMNGAGGPAGQTVEVAADFAVRASTGVPPRLLD